MFGVGPVFIYPCRTSFKMFLYLAHTTGKLLHSDDAIHSQ